MDLLSEAGGGARVLTARHISTDKTLPEPNNEINSLHCHSFSPQPDFQTYITALQSYAWVLWSCGLLALLVICIIYAVTLRSAIRNWAGSVGNVSIVLAVYPIVSVAAFIAILVPRARLLSEAIAQEAVMVAMYHLYYVIIAECGGTEQLIRRSGGSRLETRVLPCCCWPCCVIPRPSLQKQNLTWLRCLILQLPIIQGLIYVIILVLWAEDKMVYHRSLIYIQPFIVISILTGVWGVIMSVRAAESAGAKPRPRFLAVQLALIIVKVQCGLARVVPEMFTLPCIMALHPAVFINMIENSLILVEMLLLSIWAWRLYRASPVKVIDKVPHVVVAVLDDSACSLDRKPKEIVEDKSFNNRGDHF